MCKVTGESTATARSVELAQEDVEVTQVEHLARILDPHNDDRLLSETHLIQVLKSSQVT